MPVALLVQASVNALSLSGVHFHPDDITLTHDDIMIDPVSGHLSDHPVLRDDIVSVHVLNQRVQSDRP